MLAEKSYALFEHVAAYFMKERGAGPPADRFADSVSRYSIRMRGAELHLQSDDAQASPSAGAVDVADAGEGCGEVSRCDEVGRVVVAQHVSTRADRSKLDAVALPGVSAAR